MSKVAVVCHDAGGSEIISSWIMKNLNNYSFYLQGPAKKIFKDKINATSEKSLNSVISNCDWLLCGTSWQSELEKKAIQIAKNSNIKSISYIDHWVNYEERFIYNDNILLPDEIWVADKEALEIATKIFLNTEIKLIENEYLKSIQKEVEKIISSDYPVFGICLGHQMIAAALGLSTFKMHNGHRGCNHPVRNEITGKCEVTSQNHGFVVKLEDAQAKENVEITHIHLNDGTLAGLKVKGKDIFSVQFHPEASPGPHDSRYLFDQFVENIKVK